MKPPVPLGRRLQLDSGDTGVEIYWFDANGFARAILGESDGPQCAPVFRYRVLSLDSLELIGADGPVDTWTGIRIEGDALQVDSKGRLKTFFIGQEADKESTP